MGETFVTLWGNIATEPRTVETVNGVRITKFRLACTASRRDPRTGEFSDGATSWYSVTCFRELGRNVSASLIKGQPIVVYGKQVVRDWETEDKKGTEVAIEALSIGHDLRWGQASFTRVKRPAADGRPDPASEPAAELAPEPAREPELAGTAPAHRS
jgi:single-strand DNA-binding protein